MAISAKELGTSFKNKEISLLVGSGTSCACGLHSWAKLIAEMKSHLLSRCQKHDKPSLKQFFIDNEPLAIAGLFKREMGAVEYGRWLRERFRNRSVTIAPILRNVVKLPTSLIFTTNYDKLLECACRSGAGEDPVVIINPKQLSVVNGNERKIVKMHGDIDHPDTIVLTDDDYADYDSKCASMRTFVQGHIAFSTLLLIGFGLRDPNFASIYAAAKSLVTSPGPRVVALMSKQNRFDVDRWKALGLTINNFDSHDDIPKFLSSVLKHC